MSDQSRIPLPGGWRLEKKQHVDEWMVVKPDNDSLRASNGAYVDLDEKDTRHFAQAMNSGTEVVRGLVLAMEADALNDYHCNTVVSERSEVGFKDWKALYYPSLAAGEAYLAAIPDERIDM